jgi:hypothetical protein
MSSVVPLQVKFEESATVPGRFVPPIVSRVALVADMLDHGTVPTLLIVSQFIIPVAGVVPIPVIPPP